MSSSTLINLTNIDQLQPVHLYILNELTALIPAKLLRLNKSYYEQTLPRLYHTISLNGRNVDAVLYHHESSEDYHQTTPVKKVDWTNKSDALKQIRAMHIADCGGALGLCLNYPQKILRDRIQGLGKIPSVFDLVEHLHLGSELIRQASKVILGDQDDEQSTVLSETVWQIFLAVLRDDFHPHDIVLTTQLPLSLPCTKTGAREDEGELTNSELIYLSHKIINNLLKYAYTPQKTKRIGINVTLDAQDPTHNIPPLKSWCTLDKTTCSIIIKLQVDKMADMDIADDHEQEMIASKIWDHYLAAYQNERLLFTTYQVCNPNKVMEALDRFRLDVMSATKKSLLDIPDIQDLILSYEEDYCDCE